MVAVIVMLGLAEGATRLRQWIKYGHFGHLNAVHTVDPETRLRVPAANARTGTIQINALGFRGPELALPKPPGRIRIAFLGASTTFCAEVSSNDLTWPDLVTQRVQSEFGTTTFDYVNAAVPGYTVSSSLRNLQERVARLQPDVVVVYHATNDLSVETRALATQQGLFRKASQQRSWMAKHSLLWDLLEKNVRIMTLQQQAKHNQGRLDFSPAQVGHDFRTNLTALVREAASTAKLVAVATFSHRIRTEQSPEERLQAAASALYYMPFMTPDGLIAAFQRYNDIIREVARESEALLIDGETDIPADAVHFNDTVHFTDSGSRAMARRVSEALLQAPQFRKLVAQNHGV